VKQYLLVACGAALGGVARYLVGSYIAASQTGRFPVGTLVVNVTGCFLIGMLMPVLGRTDPAWRLFLVVGVLGGYTTFSTFGYETWIAARDGSPAISVLNAASSIVAGLVAVQVGYLIANVFMRR
jgi:CrcB protein